MARDTAERVRVLVVHHAPQHAPVELAPGAPLVLGRGDARQPGPGRAEAGGRHAQRAGDAVVDEAVQRGAGHPLQDALEQQQVEVGVAAGGAGWGAGRFGVQPRPARLVPVVRSYSGSSGTSPER